jgi:endoglucanase
MQMNQGGMATGLLSLPLRYMHTPCEVGSLSDIENAAKLIAAFILRLTPETDFTPSLDNLRPPRYTQIKDEKPESEASDE